MTLFVSASQYSRQKIYITEPENRNHTTVTNFRKQKVMEMDLIRLKISHGGN